LKNRSKKIKAKEAEIAKDVNTFYLSYKNSEIQDKLITTSSGLKYLLIVQGQGEFYKKGDLPTAHYFCILSRNGKHIDNSYKRGKPFTFPLGKERVIKGWDESFTFLKKGAQVFLIIPSDLAYGDKRVGDILPGDELIYYIETIQ
jgi:peptidylprolyl isomerase